MSHYVIICDWNDNNESDVDIIGVVHTYDEAKEIFEKQLEIERQFAEKNNLRVCYDTCNYYYAANDYERYTRLWIEGV